MAQRKKIALCLEYPLALRGGVSVLVEILLRGLRDHYDLVLVSSDTPESLAASSAAPIIAAHLPWNPASISPATSRQLARQFAQAGVQLAHFHFGGNFGWGSRFPGHSPIPYLNRSGIPVFSTVHSIVHPLNGFCGPQKPLWFKLALFPIAWAGKMHVLSHLRNEIAVSEHDAQKLRRWYRPMRGKFLQIYHSRLPASPPAPANPVREPVILNVGHIAWRKGQRVLAEAFAQIAPRHPEWKLRLVGHIAEKSEGNQIKDIARAHRLEDRILFEDRHENPFDFMSTAAIYVQPSYEEALGLALQEAMFCGCPGIGSKVGGIPELIEHQKTGLLVEPGNPSQLAQAIEALITNPAVRETYGRQASASIIQKGMTADQMLAHHISLYESILR
jgi:glycosyltransferase involved in cell wall biosynthesis